MALDRRIVSPVLKTVEATMPAPLDPFGEGAVGKTPARPYGCPAVWVPCRMGVLSYGDKVGAAIHFHNRPPASCGRRETGRRETGRRPMQGTGRAHGQGYAAGDPGSDGVSDSLFTGVRSS